MTLTFSLVVLLQLFSLMFVDRTLIEAAHNLRCGRVRTIIEVVIPAARVGLVIAALFCFILTFGDFVSPLYLGGGNPPTLSILIRSEEHTSELQSLMRISYAVFCLKKKTIKPHINSKQL